MALSEREQQIFNELIAELDPPGKGSRVRRHRRERAARPVRSRPLAALARLAGWQVALGMVVAGAALALGAFTTSTPLAFAGVLVALLGALRGCQLLEPKLLGRRWRPWGRPGADHEA